MNSKQHSTGTQQLKKNLGLSTAMATVVGCVIGSGVFLKPQAIYTATGGAPGLGMLAWIITGLICIGRRNDLRRSRHHDPKNRQGMVRLS